MILGKTDAQRRIDEQKRIAQGIMGVKRFAFFPVRLVNGCFVWLAFYFAVTHPATVNPYGDLTGKPLRRPVRYTADLLDQYGYHKSEIKPERTHLEFSISRAAAGEEPLGFYQWLAYRREFLKWQD